MFLVLPLSVGIAFLAVALVTLRLMPRLLRRANAISDQAELDRLVRRATVLRAAGSGSNGLGYALVFFGIGFSVQAAALVGLVLGALVFAFSTMIMKAIRVNARS